MKKVIIGLLIVAAGAGAYYYFQNKKSDNPKTGNDHTLITGTWQADSLQAGKDKSFRLNSYHFADSSTLILTTNDSLAKKDTLQYKWDKPDVISWKHAKDSSAVSFTVIGLNKDSLTLTAPDSSRILLLKVR